VSGAYRGTPAGRAASLIKGAARVQQLGDGASFSMTPMSDGWSGIDQAVSAMQTNVENALRDQRVRRACEWILHNAKAKGGDRLAEAEAIFDFVLARVEYRRDPSWLELIQDPRVLLARIEETEEQEGPGQGWAAGDCDDHAQLTEVLGLEVRLPVVSVLVAHDVGTFSLSHADLLAAMQKAWEQQGEPPIHVYAAMRKPNQEPSQAWLDGDDDAPSGLVSLDTARPGACFGKHIGGGYVRYVRDAVDSGT
jgi:hypothetical protein